jgi:hypothetical protein
MASSPQGHADLAHVIAGASSDIGEPSPMNDSEKAGKVLEALKAAESEPPQMALPILNGLVGLVQGSGESPLEVEEARSSAFMAICEVGKALHRGQPAERLWGMAIEAAEKWRKVAG